MPEFSMWDKRRGIFVPKEYTPVLAELFGVYAGDGCLAIYVRGTTTDYRLTISGSVDDEPYLQYVAGLIHTQFGVCSTLKPRREPGRAWLELICRSKAIVTYFAENGFASGRKRNIRIPEWIYAQPQFMVGFLRGLLDTDGYVGRIAKGKLGVYPVLSFQFKPKQLVIDASTSLIALGFKPCVCLDVQTIDGRTGAMSVKNHLYLNGWRNLLLWNKLIGSRNPKNLGKLAALAKKFETSALAQL